MMDDGVTEWCGKGHVWSMATTQDSGHHGVNGGPRDHTTRMNRVFLKKMQPGERSKNIIVIRRKAELRGK